MLEGKRNRHPFFSFWRYAVFPVCGLKFNADPRNNFLRPESDDGTREFKLRELTSKAFMTEEVYHEEDRVRFLSVRVCGAP